MALKNVYIQSENSKKKTNLKRESPASILASSTPIVISHDKKLLLIKLRIIMYCVTTHRLIDHTNPKVFVLIAVSSLAFKMALLE